MRESELFQPPWSDDYESPDEDDTRIACTLDIKAELARVNPKSWEEYLLCYEAAFKHSRSPKEEQYLIARYGKAYTDNPEFLHGQLEDLKNRMARHVGEFVLVQRSPTFVFINKLASPDPDFYTRIGLVGPCADIRIEISSSISTIVDENFDIVPELTRDFVEKNKPGTHLTISEGATWMNWQRDERGEYLPLDKTDACYHEGADFTVCFGIGEIGKWQGQNLKWAPLVDDMMSAWHTPNLINIGAAKAKQNSLEGNSIDGLRFRGADVSALDRLLEQRQ